MFSSFLKETKIDCHKFTFSMILFEVDHMTWPENVHCIKKKWLMQRKVICFKPFTLRLDYSETIIVS